MNTSSVNLPDVIIELILSKCPLESVVRFQSISKSWQSIISGPCFSRFYRIQRSKLPGDQNKFFFWKMPWGEPDEDPGSLYLIKLEDEKFRTKSESLLGYPSYVKYFEPLCSCDGLFLLLVDNRKYMLWNPLIRKHIIIPAFNPNWIKPYDHYNYVTRNCHLYHDSVTDDYKIVFLYGVHGYTVYSCKNGSWEEIKDLPYDRDLNRIYCTAAIDGCLYGICFTAEINQIICLDARDGKLHKFPQPEGVECLLLYELEAVLGRLCLYGFSDYQERQRLHLWVMEENGSFEKSWRKLISMETKETLISNIRPVYFTNKDDVLWAWVPKTDDGYYKHLIYNPRGNCSFKEIDFINKKDVVFDDYDCGRYFTYSENLDMPS